MSSMAGLPKIDQWGRPRGACLCCDAEFWTEREYEHMGLCMVCAKKAGAAYIKAHSGRADRFLDPEAYAQERLENGLKPYKTSIPTALRWQVYQRDAYTCVKCGAMEGVLHCDHIIPESKGGATALGNLQTLCQSCNCSKGDRV